MAKTARNAGKPSISRRLQAAYDVFRASGQWQPQSIDDLDRWMDATVSGSGQESMAYTAYFSGVMQISQQIASVSFPLFKREPKGRRRPWAEHPVFKLLNGLSNPYIDSLIWRELNYQYAMNWGNAYSWMRRDSSDRPFEVYLLDSARMKVEVKDSGEPVYLYTPRKGGERRYDYKEIFHFHGFGPNPYEGYSLIQLFRQAIALGLQQENFGNNFIKNGIHTSGVVTHPKQMSDEAHDRLTRQLTKEKGGSSNAGKILVFEEGMTWQTMSMPLKDAEFLGSRTFQIGEIARILNITPHKLKELSHATFSNVEHLQIEHITDTLRPWAERMEKAVDTQMLTPIERGKGFTQHDLDQLQRGDMKTVMDTQRIGKYAGLINADEGRFKLGLNPIDNEEIGQRYWQPTNMMDAGSDAAANGGGDTGGSDESEEMV